MNDYWNDPPEYPEPPECCGDEMNVTEDGTCVCAKCGKRIEPQPDIEPFGDVPEESFGNIPQSTECPHGKTHSCDACDTASDIAYDTAREGRLLR